MSFNNYFSRLQSEANNLQKRRLKQKQLKQKQAKSSKISSLFARYTSRKPAPPKAKAKISKEFAKRKRSAKSTRGSHRGDEHRKQKT
jgi:hypothetical protein